MKRKINDLTILVIFAGLLARALPLAADIVLHESEKAKFSFYGFLKLDATAQDGGVNGLTIPRYAAAGKGNGYLTATHSRFGFKFSPAPLKNGLNLSGTVEWDLLDPSTPNQMKFRIRQAYIGLQKGKSSVILGQTWDLFSPLGPTTLMTNGYLWQTGNLGFRHAQVRYTWSASRFEFALAAGDPASAEGMHAGLPVLQARLALKLAAQGKIQIGLSGAYGREKYENASPAYANGVAIAGLGLDWTVPFAAGFLLKGECALGQNLTYFVSRAGVLNDSLARRFAGKKVGSGWSELLYTHKAENLWLGYAREHLRDSAQLSLGELRDTGCLFAGYQHLVGGGFALGLEYANFRSCHFLASGYTTNQLIASAVYNF